jgi:predicted ATP-dependent serine protease
MNIKDNKQICAHCGWVLEDPDGFCEHCQELDHEKMEAEAAYEASMEHEEYYTTSDLSLATTLSLWYPLEDVDRSTPRRALFVFKKTSQLEKLIDEYHRNEIKVSPQLYYNQLRVMKARLYENL